MSPSPNPSDDSPLARLRDAAARLNTEGALPTSTPQATTAEPPPSRNGSAATFAARPRPEPAYVPPAADGPAHAPEALEAPAPAQAWEPRFTAPGYPPPVTAPARPHDGGGSGRRTPLIVGGVVAAVLVLALIVVGLVAMSGDDDEDEAGAPQASPTTQVTAATTLAPAPTVIPESELYAPLTGYTFGPLPEGVLGIARSPFESVPELRGMLDDLSGRLLQRSGATSVVLVYQFNDRFLSIPGATDDFLDGIAGIAAEAQPTTVAGHEGVYFVVGSSHAGVAVLDGDVAIMVQGPLGTPRPRLEQLAASFLARV